jgi:hypothetical protein
LALETTKNIESATVVPIRTKWNGIVGITTNIVMMTEIHASDCPATAVESLIPVDMYVAAKIPIAESASQMAVESTLAFVAHFNTKKMIKTKRPNSGGVSQIEYQNKPIPAQGLYGTLPPYICAPAPEEYQYKNCTRVTPTAAANRYLSDLSTCPNLGSA